jgi:hypothetical protein
MVLPENRRPELVLLELKSTFIAAVCRLHIRGSRFLSYNFLQFAIDGKNNSETKVEKAFFFIFMSSYAELSF